MNEDIKEQLIMDKEKFLKRLEELINEVGIAIENVQETGDFDYVSDYNASTFRQVLIDIYNLAKGW